MVDKLVSYDLLGFKVTPATQKQLLGFIARSIENDEQRIVASQNVHGIYVYLTDERFRSLHNDNRTCVHIDGTPIIWLGQLLGLPLHIGHRTGVRDWIMPLLQMAARYNWRVYYLGGEPEVLDKGLNIIHNKVSGISISGHHGFFDAEADSSENLVIVDRINAFRPDILIVGMGMGRQEHWISDNLHNLRVNCICTSGACMELIAGKLTIPPRWMGPAGVEWLYRLWVSPRRVAWRYLVEPWWVAWLLLRYNFRLRLDARRGK